MGTAGRAPGDLISIHAPRTGSDHGNRRACARRFISIHAPRTGSDVFADAHGRITAHFNPRSPHGERHGVLGYSPIAFEFQSTLSARGATGGIQHFVPAIAISIHAPRTGSDGRAGAYGADAADFNPRSPHGERRLLSYTHRKVTFQSTLPARGATRCTFPESRSPGISIHAPRTGSDPAASQSRQPPAISTHAPRTGSVG